MSAEDTRTPELVLKAAALTEAHRILSNVDEGGEFDGVLDHIGRLAQQAREDVRLAVESSRR